MNAGVLLVSTPKSLIKLMDGGAPDRYTARLRTAAYFDFLATSEAFDVYQWIPFFDLNRPFVSTMVHRDRRPTVGYVPINDNMDG